MLLPITAKSQDKDAGFNRWKNNNTVPNRTNFFVFVMNRLVTGGDCQVS